MRSCVDARPTSSASPRRRCSDHGHAVGELALTEHRPIDDEERKRRRRALRGPSLVRSAPSSFSPGRCSLTATACWRRRDRLPSLGIGLLSRRRVACARTHSARPPQTRSSAAPPEARRRASKTIPITHRPHGSEPRAERRSRRRSRGRGQCRPPGGRSLRSGCHNPRDASSVVPGSSSTSVGAEAGAEQLGLFVGDRGVRAAARGPSRQAGITSSPGQRARSSPVQLCACRRSSAQPCGLSAPRATAVIGEILAGVLIAPSVLGPVDRMRSWKVFPSACRSWADSRSASRSARACRSASSRGGADGDQRRDHLRRPAGSLGVRQPRARSSVPRSSRRHRTHGAIGRRRRLWRQRQRPQRRAAADRLGDLHRRGHDRR